MRSKDPRAIQVRRFRCPVCGYERVATKRRGKTGTGHVKTMWCLSCKADRDFVQLGEEERTDEDHREEPAP